MESNQYGRLSLSSQRIIAGMKFIKSEKPFLLGATLDSLPQSNKSNCILKKPGSLFFLASKSHTHDWGVSHPLKSTWSSWLVWSVSSICLCEMKFALVKGKCKDHQLGLLLPSQCAVYISEKKTWLRCSKIESLKCVKSLKYLYECVKCLWKRKHLKVWMFESEF